MTAISTWSTTPASNNAAAPDGAPEGWSPADVNNWARETMAQVRTWYEEPEWITDGLTATYASASSFTYATDVTSTYHVGRRVRAVASTPGTIYGTITASSFSGTTTVTVSFDSGSLSNEPLVVSYGASGADNRPTVGGVTVQTFTSSGTWTKPAGLRSVKVTVIGGGGGGGNADTTGAGEASEGGGGGGGGGSVAFVGNADLGATETVTIAAAAAGGITAAGANGGACSFGAHAVAGGGTGGAGGDDVTGNNYAAGGDNGIGTTGDILIEGSFGGNGGVLSGAAVHSGSGGAGAIMSGSVAQPSSGAGRDGNVYGGGGSGATIGASTGNATGGDGAKGIVIVEEYYA